MINTHTVVSITVDGRQLTASGFKSLAEVANHITERKRNPTNGDWRAFLLISSETDGTSVVIRLDARSSKPRKLDLMLVK